SILSLQIVARARKAGLMLTPKQIFEAPRVGELARLAGGEDVEALAIVAIEGEIPLTPIQRLFFERQGGESHWNQSVLLKVKGALDVAALERAIDAIVKRHDALRLNFMSACDEDWHQWLFAYEKVPVLEVIDLRAEPDWKVGLEREGERLQRSLDLLLGQLIRVGYFKISDDEGRLLLAIHHLAVDGVSWRVLFEELPEAYEQAERGEAIVLPEISTPWSVWATKLAEYAASPAVTGELGWWKARLADATDTLPLEGEGDTRTGAARSVGMELDRETTRRLLQEVPRAYRMR
ncbi:condensation domain-containing protein, partial [Neorhizobium sp. DT-125]|uniref:condensation domain-containing protein n=1 Tax=Neorhizobium sp. DT-125 TaxID=3396163 RepID=UPI003F199733